MTSSDIRAIDVHGHYGSFPASNDLVNGLSSATGAVVADRARVCGIEWTLVSPLAGLMPRAAADAAAANEQAHVDVPSVPGLLQYVIVNPRQPRTFDQARAMLRSPWCLGIKIHPEEHGYRIADHGEQLFMFFEEVGAPVMTHSGCPGSLPADFVPFANRHPAARVVLAHLGNGAGDGERADLQVRAVQSARHGNLWIDTSSARSLVPGLVEWAVREVGAERLLFGSDTPLYHVAMQRARIDAAEIPLEARRLILRDNAVRLFGLDATAPRPAPPSAR